MAVCGWLAGWLRLAVWLCGWQNRLTAIETKCYWLTRLIAVLQIGMLVVCFVCSATGPHILLESRTKAINGFFVRDCPWEALVAPFFILSGSHSSTPLNCDFKNLP